MPTNCQNCGFANEPDARFCENCGQSLERRCPNCGKPASPTARFCKNCGFDLTGMAPPVAAPRLADLHQAAPSALQDKIRSAVPGVAGERKLVTALFVDIVGSTELAAAMDPEDWREVVTGAHQCVSQAVYRYEGTIAQLLGDGVLAFFGAPLAHEDDAERAIRAALAMLASIQDYSAELRRRRLASGLQIRVGVNTGMVVVGNIGSNLHMEYLAIGDTVNLAARMQSAAEPGTILIAEAAFRLVAPYFEVEDLGEIAVKGKPDPVHVYRVLAERKGAGRVRGIEGLSSPLVARQREFATLMQVAHDLRAGRGGIVSVMGEAGLGKSRLMAEWQQALGLGVGSELCDDGSSRSGQPSAPGLRWAEGRGLSYGAAVPYHLATDILRALIGAGDEASDEETLACLRQSCRQLLGEEMPEVPLFLAHMLGLKLEAEDEVWFKYLDGPALQSRYASAYRHLVEAIARQVPTILFVEDVHWADPSSVELGLQMLSMTAQVPLVIVLAARPDRDSAGWRLVTGAREVPGTSALELHLAPLSEADSCQLVDNLLDQTALPEGVRQLILSKAEGNPFFVEEVIRMLIEDGVLARQGAGWAVVREVEAIEIPDTLQGVIMARIDRLPEETKHVLQVASVIGRQFQVHVLEMVLAA